MLDKHIVESLERNGYGRAIKSVLHLLENGLLSLKEEDKKMIESLWLAELDLI